MTVRPRSRSTAADRHDAPAASAPGRIVATVAGRRISTDHVEGRLADLRRGPRARHIPPNGMSGSIDLHRWVVQELVTEEVLAHEARAAGIAGAAESARLWPSDVAGLVDRVTVDIVVPEADLHAYYERNRDLYAHPEARRVRHLLFGDEVAAREVAASLVAGADPVVLHELGDVRRGELTGPLEDAIFRADRGTVVGPIPTERGWHVLLIETVTAPFVTPFAEARPAIEAELLAAARGRAFDEWLERRRRALAVIEPEFEHPGHPIHGVPSHRH